MDIRNERVSASEFQYDDCMITSKNNVDPKVWLTYDQVLTGTNRSRHRINRFFRSQLGHKAPLPLSGEKMICIKNNYRSNPIFINGVIFKSIADVDPDTIEEGISFLSMIYEGRELTDLQFYNYHCLLAYNDNLIEEPREFRRELFECDYAYAITVHKSQGSEWNSVLVADDGMMKNKREFRRRWLYTAVTRAKSKLLIVQ
jgi:exodeoxyribonuclease-5